MWSPLAAACRHVAGHRHTGGQGGSWGLGGWQRDCSSAEPGRSGTCCPGPGPAAPPGADPTPRPSLPRLQSLVAFHLGKGDRRSAADVFRRTLSLAVFAGVLIMGGLLAAQTSLPGVFTQDAAVVQQVKLVRLMRGPEGAALCAAMYLAGLLCWRCLWTCLSPGTASALPLLPCPAPLRPPQVLPLIAVFMPLDAAASVMDGVLLGSQEAGWLSKTMAVTAGVCAVGLLASQRLAWPLTTIWFVIKFLAVGRLIGARSWLACAVHQPSLLGQRCVSLVVARPGPAWPVHQKEAHPALPAGLLVQAMPGGCGPGAAHWRGSCARLRHDGSRSTGHRPPCV